MSTKETLTLGKRQIKIVGLPSRNQFQQKKLLIKSLQFLPEEQNCHGGVLVLVFRILEHR